MYIRIVNKNRIANNNTFTDFQRYDLDEGCVYTNNYNEELDNMQCRISNINVEIEIEPFDRVVIYDNDNNILNVMLVYNWQSTMNGYRGDATYTYELQLCSLTKELENYVLPDLSITPHKIGNKLNILQYINRYLDLYAPNKYYISGSLSSFGNIYAPELQWNKPTLREVLTSLMMINDCIPIIKYQNNRFELSCIDLTQKKDAITTYNYIQRSQSADNYVSELRMDMQNVMQENSVITTTEFIPFSSNGGNLITSENLVLKTKYPILNIKHLYMCLVCKPASLENYIYKADLCKIRNKYFENFTPSATHDTDSSIVYEKKEYDTLETLYRYRKNANYREEGYFNNYFSKYQNYCIYYTRGGNTIDGFSKLTLRNAQDVVTDAKTYSTLIWLKRFISLGDNGSSLIDSIINDPTNSYYSTYFQVEYETQYDQVFQASKQGKQHHRVIADNQTNSWVDATTQGNLEYQKANRLGNEIVLINQRVSSLANAIECADYLDDNIVYKTEYQIYSDHIDVNAYATKNYILQDYWTGINSKIRTWVNAQEEAFRRLELKKFYCVFDTKAHNDTNVTSSNLNRKLLSPLNDTPHNKPIKYVGFRSVLGQDSKLPESWENGYLYVDNVLSRVIGKSMILSFNFDDNWVIGNSPDLSSTDIDATGILPRVNDAYTTTYGGITAKPKQYVNANGETTQIEYQFANDIYVSWNDTLDVGVKSDELFDGINDDIANKFCVWTFNKPLALDDTINEFKQFENTLTIYKDNKEIPTINTQFEFMSASDDILVTNEFVNLQGFVANYENDKEIKIYGSNTLNLRSNQLPSGATQLVGATYQIDYTGNNRAKITITGNTYDYTYITIGGALVLAFAGNEVYFNILTNRDTNIYNAQGIITGEI